MRKGAPTGDQIALMFRTRATILSQHDKYIRIEMAFFSAHTGPGAGRRLKSMIEESCPRKGDRRTVAMVEQAFTNMADGKLMGFCSLGVRSIFHTVHGWAKCIAEQKLPGIRGAAKDEFAKGCLDRLVFLISREALGGSEAAKNIER